MSDDYIWVVTEATDEGEKGVWGEAPKKLMRRIKEVQLKPEDLENKMSAFLQMVGRLFKQAEQDVSPQSGLRLDEVELSVEISAEGEVKLIAGGKAAGKGAITLKFKRPDSK